MPVKVVSGSNAEDSFVWKATAYSIHQGSASRTEVVRHRIHSCDSLALSKLVQLFLATQVLQAGIRDDEVGCEHRGGYLSTVGTIADEGIHQIVTLSRPRTS